MRAIPQAAVDLVKEAEGLRLTAYPDPATGGAPWTIGYGHTGPDVRPGLRITKAQAEQLLQADLDTAAAVVDRAVTVELTDAQRGALVSFVFNVGAGRKAKGKDAGKDGFVVLKSGQPSTMLRKLNVGDAAAAAAEFAKWTRGAGKVMPGLVARRAAEAALFTGSDWTAVARSSSGGQHHPQPQMAPAPAGAEADRTIAIQRKLAITADGIYGPATTRAVQAWQRANGLVADGVVGPKTAKAMGLA